MPSKPWCAPPVDTCSTRDPLASFGINALVRNKGPSTFDAIVARNPSSVNASRGPSGPVVDRSVRRCDGYHRGGEAEAHQKLETFLTKRLDQYAARRNDPGLGLQSHLSPHVHYGQISVIYLTYRALCVARGARRAPAYLRAPCRSPRAHRHPWR